MKSLVTFFLFVSLFSSAVAGEPFIRSVHDADAGSALRIVSTPDQGWAVFFLATFKLYKFNSCGTLEWSRQYHVPPTTWTSNDFIQTQSGGFAFSTRIPNGSVSIPFVTKLDANGNIVWCKTYGEPQYDYFPYTISEDSQGNLFLWGNAEHVNSSPFYNLLSKISSSGNVLWTKFYDHGGIWGGAIVTSDDGVLARTGSTFIKTDASGNVQWTAAYYAPSTYYYYAPVEVSDGYIYTTMVSPGTAINFHKIDKQGHLLWGGYKHTNIPSLPAVLRKKSNGHFIGVFNGDVVEFDKDLSVIHASTLDDGLGLLGKDLCFLNDGTPVLAGISNTDFFISKTDAQYHTSCDQATPALVLSQGNASANFLPTQSISYTLNVASFTLTYDTLNILTSAICSSPISLDLGPDIVTCGGVPIVLQNLTGTTFDSYSWSTGEITSSIAVNQSGIYRLAVTKNCGLDTLYDSISVSVLPVVPVDLGSQATFCKDSTLLLTAPPCDLCLFEWSTGSHENHLEVTEPGLYWLKITYGNGCISGDTVVVTESKCDCNLFLPSAFTPNHDGRNEIFQPVYYCDVQDYELKIFDRWGRLVFASDHPDTGWDGTKNNASVMPGVYIYTVSYSPLLQGKEDVFVSKTGTVVVTY